MKKIFFRIKIENLLKINVTSFIMENARVRLYEALEKKKY